MPIFWGDPACSAASLGSWLCFLSWTWVSKLPCQDEHPLMEMFVPGHLGSVTRQNDSVTLAPRGQVPAAPKVIWKQLLTSQAFKYLAGSIKMLRGGCWIFFFWGGGGGCFLFFFFPKSLLNTNKKVFIHFCWRDWQSKDAESLGSFGEPLILLDMSFVSNITSSSWVRSGCHREPDGGRPTFALQLGQQALRSSAQHGQAGHIFISPC